VQRIDNQESRIKSQDEKTIELELKRDDKDDASTANLILKSSTMISSANAITFVIATTCALASVVKTVIKLEIKKP